MATTAASLASLRFEGLAVRLKRPLIIVSCGADPATLSARVRARAERGNDPSDADQHVLEAQLRHLMPFDAMEQTALVAVDTRDSAVVDQVVAELRARI